MSGAHPGGLVATEARRVRYRFSHVVGFSAAGVVVVAAGTFVHHLSNAYSPDDLRAAVAFGAAPFALAALAIGASMFGNDLSTRVLTTSLLYEPRRRRVLAARVAACAAAMAALTAVALTGLALALLPSLGPTATATGAAADAGWWASMGALVGRASVLAGAAAATGAALAALTRGTFGALAVGAGHAFLVEQPAAAFWPALAQWLPIANAVSWVTGDGPHSTPASAAALAALVLTLLAAADLAFRHQDLA